MLIKNKKTIGNFLLTHIPHSVRTNHVYNKLIGTLILCIFLLLRLQWFEHKEFSFPLKRISLLNAQYVCKVNVWMINYKKQHHTLLSDSLKAFPCILWVLWEEEIAFSIQESDKCKINWNACYCHLALNTKNSSHLYPLPVNPFWRLSSFLRAAYNSFYIYQEREFHTTSNMLFSFLEKCSLSYFI